MALTFGVLPYQTLAAELINSELSPLTDKQKKDWKIL